MIELRILESELLEIANSLTMKSKKGLTLDQTSQIIGELGGLLIAIKLIQDKLYGKTLSEKIDELLED